MALFAYIFGSIFLLGALLCCIHKIDFRSVVFITVGTILMGFGITIASESAVYTETSVYVPAEIVAENENYTFFSTNDGHIFCVDKNENWPTDVPYLLDVETHGTDDVTDDEVLVVWRTE